MCEVLGRSPCGMSRVGVLGASPRFIIIGKLSSSITVIIIIIIPITTTTNTTTIITTTIITTTI